MTSYLHDDHDNETAGGCASATVGIVIDDRNRVSQIDDTDRQKSKQLEND